MENPIVNTVAENTVEQTAPVVDIQEKTNEVINNLKNDINEKLIKEEQQQTSAIVEEQPVTVPVSEPAPEVNDAPTSPTETTIEVNKESSVSESQVSADVVAKPKEDETVVNAPVVSEAPPQPAPVSETPAPVADVAPVTETTTVATTDAATTNNTSTTKEAKEKKKKEKKEKKKDKKSNDENVEPGTVDGENTQVKRKESVGAKIKRVFTLGKSDKNKKNASQAVAVSENGQTKVETPSTVEEKPESNGEVKPVVEEAPVTAQVPVAVNEAEVPIVDAEAIAAAGDPVPAAIAKDVELVTEATVKEAACALEAAQAANAATGDAQQDAATATSPIDKSHKQCIII